MPSTDPELSAGDHVIIVGLVSRPELNGTAGVLEDFEPNAGRWTVKFSNGQAAIREQNLQIIAEEEDDDHVYACIDKNASSISPQTSVEPPPGLTAEASIVEVTAPADPSLGSAERDSDEKEKPLRRPTPQNSNHCNDPPSQTSRFPITC